jgi:RNA 3'-terminal phosphate cyclase (ATP)
MQLLIDGTFGESAGSTTLVFQTVLPALMLAPGDSTLRLRGGTHNPMAPSFHFLEYAFLPWIRRLGAGVETKLSRFGFFPVGGGEFATTADAR